MSNIIDTSKKVPIICMPVTIRIMRAFQVFPPKGKELEPGIRFYLKFLLISVISCLPWLSSILHLVKTLQSKENNRIELDVNYAVSFTTTYALVWAYFVKIKSVSAMYNYMSDFETFGKPLDFDRDNMDFNKYAKMHFVYLESLIWIIIFTSNIFKKETCHLENQARNMTEVCGLFTYTWTPFNIDFFPVREIYMLVQVFGVHHLYMVAGLMAWLVFETTHHIVVRIRHVKHVIIEALAEKDPVIRRDRFRGAVQYHNSLFGLEYIVNDAFSIFQFTHMVLTAAVLGTGIYSLLHAKSLSTFMVCTGWFWGLFMDCFSGQRLRDESLELAVAVYESPWYTYEVDLQMDVMLVLKRCQTSLQLRAGSFGVMDRAMFLGVLKVTYSYIALLQNT
ncbi:odorant receptor 63a-like [Diabrotica virgifera virgifera]|uniref:Odorant receptor n=1 Tax=Diabrotica virgifera virgifera TaxID=50390 RepID=A0ABM5KGM5_DIAVI|nr:odorant receptor 63a-like [Diabrotica virgifera virgifera]